jgi:glycosyltransferase involved in cell wall biosynthesis
MLEERIGKIVRPDKEVYLMSSTFTFSLDTLSQAATSVLFPFILLLSKYRREEVVINTYGDLVDYLADLAYINAIPVRLSHKVCSGFPNSFTWRIACHMYNVISSFGLSFRSPLISNSKFIQRILLKDWGRNSIVIYPPVDTDVFAEMGRKAKRENLVVSVSRFRHGKRLDMIPKVARLVKEAEFIIVGISDGASKAVLKNISSLIKQLRVNDRVKLLVNQPLEEYINVLSSASLYLHTQPSEAFGISVVEAMAAGCVPIVPRSGGPWIDILDGMQGLYGFSYSNETEAANIIKTLLNEENLRRDVAARASRRSSNFNKFIFERRVLEVVDKVYGAKNRSGIFQ